MAGPDRPSADGRSGGLLDGPPDDLPGDLAWPDGLDARRFLRTVWQRRPLLLRAALPGFETPLPADELAGLALEPDTTPRLLLEDGDESDDENGRGSGTGTFRVEHGPFAEDRFANLPARYSLLVTDVEKHLPELSAWIRAFRVAPSWRFDDLMVSYAPDGGSVGAHVDAYDVFLLQASGARRWSIDARYAEGGELAGAAAPTVRRGDLGLVEPFEPTDAWELAPGDVLYLPPGVPHHGVAVGDGCTTWSIGFRAPSPAEIVAGVAALLIDDLDAAPMPDPPLVPGTPGEIAPASLAALRAAWDAAVRLDDARFAELVGRVLTTHRFERAHDPDSSDDDGSDGAADGLERSSFARLAWVESDAVDERGDVVTLFANGEAVRCSRGLARALCDPDAPLPAAGSLGPSDASALERLVELDAVRRGAAPG